MLKVPLMLGAAAFLSDRNERDMDLERGQGQRDDDEDERRGRSSTSSSSRTVGRRRREVEEAENEKGVMSETSEKTGEVDVGERRAGNDDNDNDEADDADDEQEDSGANSPKQPDGDDTEAEIQLNLFGRVRQRCARFWHFVLQTGPNADGDGLEHIPNYRWLPIFSGIVIPFSILLEIPGLTEHWYVVTENNVTVLSRPNGGLLDTGLGVSMACALVANLAIINRFLERRIRTSTLVAIVALSIHDIINIVAVTYFGVIHRFNDGFTYGQSFWFTVCSTIASVFTNVTLIVDYVRTPDFAYASSGLTRKQRSLVIVVMILLCWIALGALINGLLMSLSFINGLYFTVVTIETIGFGDIFPGSPGAKVFAGLHGTVGVLFVALAVSTANETIIESFEHSYRKHLEGLRERHRERKLQRNKSRASNKAMRRQLERAGLPVYVYTHTHYMGGGRQANHRGLKRLNIDALSSVQKLEAEREAEEICRIETEPLSRKSTLSSFQTFDATFADSLQKEFVVKLTVVWTLFLMFWFVGAAIFMATEGWTFGRGMWFCFESFSTIGYGDQTPQTPAGRAVFIVWALLGVGTMTILISVLSEAYSSRYQKVLNAKVSKPRPTVKDIVRPEMPAFKTTPMMDIIHEPAASPSRISRRNFRRQFTRRRRHSSLPNMGRERGEESEPPDHQEQEQEQQEMHERQGPLPAVPVPHRSGSIVFAPTPSIRPSLRGDAYFPTPPSPIIQDFSPTNPIKS